MVNSQVAPPSRVAAWFKHETYWAGSIPQVTRVVVDLFRGGLGRRTAGDAGFSHSNALFVSIGEGFDIGTHEVPGHELRAGLATGLARVVHKRLGQFISPV